ncbi:hypothetical protein MMAS_42640 [Mycobacteroides abscessus subsp. massiliense CCUG 48898 = JCM 15300]|nr:hypothetical protein MMAS_42640 [Mycobacteroides abscessus subsp. massiliense CCUG 48898 = JCM 15300]
MCFNESIWIFFDFRRKLCNGFGNLRSNVAFIAVGGVRYKMLYPQTAVSVRIGQMYSNSSRPASGETERPRKRPEVGKTRAAILRELKMRAREPLRGTVVSVARLFGE